MFLAGLFITVLYSVSYLAFTITGKAVHKLHIVMNSFHHLHSSLVCRRVEDVILLIQSTSAARLIWTSCGNIVLTSFGRLDWR